MSKIKVIQDGTEYKFKSVFICGVNKNNNTISGFIGKTNDVDKAIMEREINFRLQKEREKDFKRMEQ